MQPIEQTVPKRLPHAIRQASFCIRIRPEGFLTHTPMLLLANAVAKASIITPLPD
jgi:hypothetical protein